MSDHSQGQKIGENISAWSLQSLFCSLRIIMCFLKYRFQGHDYGTERCYVWWSCNDQSCITLQIPLSVKKFLIHGISVRLVLSSLCGWFKSQTQNAKWFSVTPLHPAMKGQSWSLTQSQKNGVGMVQYGTKSWQWVMVRGWTSAFLCSLGYNYHFQCTENRNVIILALQNCTDHPYQKNIWLKTQLLRYHFKITTLRFLCKVK